MSSIDKLIEDSISKNEIRELYLYQLPTLKNITNWNLVKEVSKVQFKGKHANYYGGLVRFQNSIYFLPDNMINALASFRKWNFMKTVNVITEDEWKIRLKKKK